MTEHKTVNCLNCNKLFTQRNSLNKYCCFDCHRQYVKVTKIKSIMKNRTNDPCDGCLIYDECINTCAAYRYSNNTSSMNRKISK
jgi:hypothetical protein